MSPSGLFLSLSERMRTGARSRGLGYTSPSPQGAAAMYCCGPFCCKNKPLGHHRGVCETWGHRERKIGLIPEKSSQTKVLWQTLAVLYWC